MNQTLSTAADVTARFAGLVSAIKRYEDDLKIDCAEAALEGNMPMTRTLSEQTQKVMVFEAAAVALAERWAVQHWDAEGKTQAGTPNNQPGRAFNHKAAPAHLRVTVMGRTIEHSKASDTFADALELIGLPRIAALHLRSSGVALVSHEPTSLDRSQACRQGWYVTTHSNTAEKKRILEEIGRVLHVPLNVVIV